MGDGFKIVQNFHLDQISSVMEINMKMFLDNAFLRIGAWGDAIIGQEAVNGSVLTTLYPLPNEDGIIDYTRYQSMKHEWVWEQGVVYSDGINIKTPIQPTIYTNGIPNTGNKVDYRSGIVTFDYPQLPTTRVEATYSYRNVSIFTSQDGLNRPYIEFDSNNSFLRENYNQAFYDTKEPNTVQLPYINIETFPQGSARPLAIGTGSLNVNRRIQLNIAAATPNEISKIADCINLQSYKAIPFWDMNKVVRDGVFPLNYDGTLNPSGISYQKIIEWNGRYRMSNLYLGNIVIRRIRSPRSDIFLGSSIFTAETTLAKSF